MHQIHKAHTTLSQSKRSLLIIYSTLTALMALGSACAFAQNDQSTVAFAGYDWTINAREAVIETHLGREALRLTAGRVIADDIAFLNGVIEFEAAFEEQQSFIGAGWRLTDAQNFEEMYFRAHLNNEPDTLQYTPVYNGLSAWQMFYDEFSIAPLTHNYESWNRVKIVVDGDSANIYYNDNTEPALHIRELDRDQVTGAINLRVSGRGTGPVYFSNFSVSPLGNDDRITAASAPDIELPEGLIQEWEVSTAFPESLVADAKYLSVQTFDSLQWQTHTVSDKGFANLAQLRLAEGDNDTVLIRATIDSNTEDLAEMLFGYSDRVRIYLNGKRIFTGIGGWRIRNYSYMGLVSFHDTVGLDLQAGENEVLIAVSETFGGWAWGAAINN